MNLMVSLVKHLQIIVHMLMFKTIVPANASIFFSSLIDILTFDPIDLSEQVAYVYSLDPKEI